MIDADEGRSQEVVEASLLLQNRVAAVVKSQTVEVAVGGENQEVVAAVRVKESENQVEGEALENQPVEGVVLQLENQEAEVEANQQEKQWDQVYLEGALRATEAQRLEARRSG